MGIVSYRIVRNGAGWGVEHDGRTAGEYLTREAAFEATIGPASNALHQGEAISIVVPAVSPEASGLDGLGAPA